MRSPGDLDRVRDLDLERDRAERAVAGDLDRARERSEREVERARDGGLPGDDLPGDDFPGDDV